MIERFALNLNINSQYFWILHSQTENMQKYEKVAVKIVDFFSVFIHKK